MSHSSSASGTGSGPFFRSVLIGLAVAQLLATAQVFFSTRHLHAEILALHQAGYLEIPTLAVLQRPGAIAPAVFGGLFFTLSIGAGLTLATIGACWVWQTLARHNRLVLILLTLLWAGSLVLINLNGLNVFASLYFTLVPAAVALSQVRRPTKVSDSENGLRWLVPLWPLALLAMLWGSQADSRLFVDIRDYLLLSNPLGRSINDFYYRYTLYAAEVFKSLDQKLQRPCRIGTFHPPPLYRRLEIQLRHRDYLALKNDGPVVVRVEQNGEGLVWLDREKPVLKVPAASFFANPAAVLSALSEKTDRSAYFRRFTFFGILFAFPILLYSGVYGAFKHVGGFFLRPSHAALFSASLCFLVGALFLVPVSSGNRRPVTAENLAAAIGAPDWRERVAALKLIEKSKLEIAAFPSYRDLLASRHLPERYWLARALAVSRDGRTIADVVKLARDPHPNVICQALHALGQRRRPETVDLIREIISSTDSWYVQRYGYIALRSLGWRQPLSN
ncbi:MAG: HEAT repeat domain-containing protein [Desulfobacterales bacterium]